MNTILSKHLIVEEEMRPLSLSVRDCDAPHRLGQGLVAGGVAVAAFRIFLDQTFINP